MDEAAFSEYIETGNTDAQLKAVVFFLFLFIRAAEGIGAEYETAIQVKNPGLAAYETFLRVMMQDIRTRYLADPDAFDLEESLSLVFLTESNRSGQLGKLEGAIQVTESEENNVTLMKRWIAFPNCCDTCLAMALKGPIPLKEPFAASGKVVEQGLENDYDTFLVCVAHPGDRCMIEIVRV